MCPSKSQYLIGAALNGFLFLMIVDVKFLSDSRKIPLLQVISGRKVV